MLENPSRLPERVSGTNHKPQEQNNINVQRALWVAIIFTSVAFASFVLSIILNFQFPAWQIFLMAIIAGLSLTFDFISVVLIRRGRAALALRILYWSILTVLPLNVLLFVGVTPILIGIVLTMGYVEVFLLFPPAQRKYFQFGPAVSAIAMGLIEFDNPSFRYELAKVPTTGYWGQIVLGFLIVGIIVMALRQRLFIAGALGNISTGLKMGLMVAIFFLGMAGITVAAYIGVQSLKYQFSNIYDFMLVPITSIEGADTSLAQSQYYIAQVLRSDISAVNRSDGFYRIQADNLSAENVISRYDTEWVTTSSPQFTRDLKNAGKLDLQNQEVATLKAYHTAYAAYKSSVTKFLAAGKAGRLDSNLANDAVQKLDTVHIELQNLIGINNKFADFSNTSAQAAIQRALLTGAIALGINVILGILMSYLIVISITSRLGSLTRSAKAMQQGNLNQFIEISGRDEIGVLGSSLNTMAEQLKGLFGTLEQRVAARTKDLAIVAEVGTATTTILETGRLLQEVVDLTKERFNLYHSHIYLLDQAGENLVLAAGAGEPGRKMMAKGQFIPLNREQSLVARSARERKGVTVNDVTQAPDFLPNPLLPDTRSELAVPMVAGGNLVGVFDIQSDQVGRFTESDINIQTTLAAQVAISIQNVRTFEQSRTQATLETLVNTIGQKIQRTVTVEDTLQTAVRELGMALGAARVKANIQARHPDNQVVRNANEVEHA